MQKLILLLVLTVAACRGPAPAEVEVKPSPVNAIQAAVHAVEISHLLAPPIDALPSDAIRGLAIPMYSEFPGLLYEDMVKRAISLGATHVSLVVTWDQRTIFDNRIRPHVGQSPSDERVAATIDAAHKLGLKVMLFPIIHVVQRSEGEWRGKMAPTDLGRWQREYREFIRHYAAIAQSHQVEILSVGSELSSQENHEAFWREIIADVRTRFTGKLVYSANWDHYRSPGFWDAVDYIGVSSYFEVAKSPSEPTFVVTQRWEEQRRLLLEFAKAQERPIMLTEVGYPAVTTAAVHPWDYTPKGGADVEQQLAAFRSLVDGWRDVTTDDFAGAFVWHGWGWGGKDDTSYNVFSKPSEAAVRSWFGGPSSPR
jgi:hypothetical protein